MNAQQQSLQELQQIKMMMERSSKFISLSGLSGIAAGMCALAGAGLASAIINRWNAGVYDKENLTGLDLQSELLTIALLTFVGAFLTAFVFTYLRSKKTGIPLWGATAYRYYGIWLCHWQQEDYF